MNTHAMRPLARTCLLSALALTCAPAVLAQSAAKSGSEGPLSFAINLTGQAETSSKFKNDAAGGSVTVYRAGVALDLGYKFDDHWRAGLGFENEQVLFNFRNATGLVAGSPRPFSHVMRTSLAPSITYTFNNTWSLTGGGLLEFTGEPDADVGDSFSGGGFVMAGYKVNDKLSLRFGVAARSRLENSAEILPIFGIVWKIDDKTTFFTRERSATLDRKVAEHCSIYFRVAYVGEGYRLTDSNPVVDGVFRERSIPITIGTTYRCCENFTLDAGIGVTAWRRLRIDNSVGSKVGQVDTKPNAIFTLGGRITF